MCDTHTHGPAAVATAPQHLWEKEYLTGATQQLLHRVALSLENTLAHPLLSTYLDEQTVRDINSQTMPAKQLAIIIDKISSHYTQLAGQAYATGNASHAKELMQEMKETITKVQQEISSNK